MPIQVYECKTDGEFEIKLSFQDEIPKVSKCPDCGTRSNHIISPVGGIKLSRTWNEQANEAQRDPYTQAKAQAYEAYHGRKERGENPPKPTEETLQVVAEGIAKNPTSKEKGIDITEAERFV